MAPQNTNSAVELSNYLKNMAEANDFERHESSDEVEGEQEVRNDSQSASESVINSQRSYQDQMEEGKSLMEDFHARVRGDNPLMGRVNNQNPNNYQGRLENIKEQEEEYARNRIRMPPIPSEGSRVSQSGESHNFNAACVPSKGNSNEKSKKKQVDEERKSEDKSVSQSIVNFSKNKVLSNDISELKLSSRGVSKKSSPRVGYIIKKNTMFIKDDKEQFLDAVYPFQEDFSHDNTLMMGKAFINSKTNNLPCVTNTANFSKSVENFSKIGKVRRAKIKYQRSTTPDLKDEQKVI